MQLPTGKKFQLIQVDPSAAAVQVVSKTVQASSNQQPIIGEAQQAPQCPEHYSILGSSRHWNSESS
jgi:hypothetical protein